MDAQPNRGAAAKARAKEQQKRLELAETQEANALSVAAVLNDTERVVALLASGDCDPNHQDSEGCTPAFYAAATDSCHCLRILAEHGADLDQGQKAKARAQAQN